MLLSTLTLAAASTVLAPAAPATPSVDATDEATRALVARLTEVADDVQEQVRGLRASTNFSMTVADGNRTIVITSKDGDVSATVDGTEVPADQISREGDAWIIRDRDGETLHRFPVAITRLGEGDFEIELEGLLRRGARNVPGVMNRIAPGRFPGGLDADENVWIGQTPSTMLGVHLESPGDVLCAQLGLNAEEATVITGVLAGLPAEAGGLKPFDVVIAIDGTAPAGPEAIREAMSEAAAGDEIVLTVVRRGTPRDLTITVESWDQDRMASAALQGRTAVDEQDPMEIFFGQPLEPGALRLPGHDASERVERGQIFIAPDKGDGDVRVFRGPGDRFNFTLPGGAGRLELDRESLGEMQQALQQMMEQLQTELRRDLPVIMGEKLRENVDALELEQLRPLIREQIIQLEPMLREQIVELQPMIRQQIIELQPLIREQMQAHGPKIGEAIMLAEQLQGKNPQEMAAIIVERLNPSAKAPAAAEPRQGTITEVVPDDDRAEMLEDRMDRIETLLQRVIERLESRDRT